MAREVGAIVVGVVVGYFLGPQAGFAAAALVYGATAPNAKVEGPRLTDLKAPQASYGGVIPYLEGSPRTAGVYAWYSDKHEIANESSQGGKGGPGVDNTLFTYEIDALILFSINQLVGIRRVWSNGKLVWSAADDADAQTLQASAEQKNWRGMRFYSGADTQLPDPTYEAAVGIGNAPAYRGRASVFIEGLSLGQSGQLPVLTFEVVSSGNLVSAMRISTVYDAQVGIGLPSGIASYVGPHHIIYGAAYDNNYLTRDLITITNIDESPFYRLGTDALPALAGNGPPGSGTVNLINGMADESYWLAVGQTSSILRIVDSIGHEYNAVAPSPIRTASTYARYSGNTLLLLSGSPPYTTYPRGLSDGVLVTSTSYDPFSATLFAAHWYILPYVSNGVISFYDSALAAAGTITDPRDIGGTQGILCTDAVTGIMYMLYGATLFKWGGAAWSVYFSSLPSAMKGPNSSASTGISVVGGTLYSVVITPGPHVIVSKAQLDTTLSIVPVPLDQVVSRMCLRTGLLGAGDIDVTALAADNVRAFAVSTVAPTRAALESLMAGFLFEAVEAEKIKFVKRGGAAVLTIPYKDLGASSGTPGDPLPLRRLNDIEQPARITVKYANTTNDYQDGAESGDRLVTQSTAISVVELPIGFTPGEAKRVADAHTMDVAVSLIGVGPVALTRKYPQLEPTDVVILTAKDGSTFRARIQKATAATGVNTFDLVLDDASVINSVAATDPNYNASTLIRLVSNSTLLLLDIPILRDTDNAPGIYAAVNAVAPWPGASLYRSSDNITYTKSIGTTTQVVTGVTTTLLGNWAGGAVFDETNAVTVNVGAGQLASVTRDVLLSTNQNALLIGSEIVQFRNAVLAGAGIYTVSGFMRGRRGTEWATGTHAVGERVVLLQATTLKRITESTADIGSPVWWKAVTIGKSVASAAAQVFTDRGVALKPFAPVDLRKGGDDSSVIVTWKRRSRLATRFTGSAGISVPLGEASESYAVELRNASDVLVSTDTVAAPQWSGTSATIADGLQTVAWGLRTIGGELVGIQDDNINRIVGVRYIVRMDTSGAVIGLSPSLGTQVYQWANSGDELYAATADLSSGPGVGSYLNGKVQRVTRTAIGAIVATYTAATPGDVAGVACDGTNVWMTERYGGKLRKLDAATLASVITYPLSTGVGALYYDSGSLWICSGDTNQIIQWNIAGAVETQRFSCVTAPFDLLIVGSLIFVQGATAVGVYTKSTGALVSTLAVTAPIYLAQHSLYLFGSYVAVGGLYVVKLLDSTTGALSRSIQTGRPYADYIARIDPHGAAVDAGNTFFFTVSGAYSAKLYLTVGNPGRSNATLGYQLSAPALTGYSLTVAQIGAAGRGYATSLSL